MGILSGEAKVKMIKYRDAGMHTYTYFWVDENNRLVSPFFNGEVDALKWKESDEVRHSGKE